MVVAMVAGLAGLSLLSRSTPSAWNTTIGYVMAAAMLGRRRWPSPTMAIVRPGAGRRHGVRDGTGTPRHETLSTPQMSAMAATIDARAALRAGRTAANAPAAPASTTSPASQDHGTSITG